MAKPRPRLPAMDRLAARLLEMADEELAPAAQRQAVLGPSGVVLREAIVEREERRDPDDMNPNRRAAKTVSGFRRRDTLRHIAFTNASVTDEHLDAAERLAIDWELAAGGGGGDSFTGVRVDISAISADPPIVAMTRFRKAVQAVGQIGCSVLLPVVLENVTITALGERMRLRRQTISKRLVDALDTLVKYYDGTKRHGQA